MGAAVGRPVRSGPATLDADSEGDVQTGRWCEMCEFGRCGNGARVTKEPPVEYTIITYTGSDPGSGSDANVYLTMYGHSGGASPRLQLSDALSVSSFRAGERSSLRDLHQAARAVISSRFERGSVDTFRVQLPPFGDPTKIRIGHDNSGLGPGWFLSKVVITRTVGDPKTTWEFPCERWLAEDQDDSALERELAAGVGAMAPHPRSSTGPVVVARASCTMGPSIVLSRQSASAGLLAWSIRSRGSNSLICIGAVPADCKGLDSTPPDGAAWCVTAASGLSRPFGRLEVQRGDRFRVVADLDHGALTVMKKRPNVHATHGNNVTSDDEWQQVGACDDRLDGEIRLCLCLWGGADVELLQEHDRSFAHQLAAAQKRHHQRQLKVLTHATFGLRAADHDRDENVVQSRTPQPCLPELGGPSPRRAASSTLAVLDPVSAQRDLSSQGADWQTLTDTQQIERLHAIEKRVVALKQQGQLHEAIKVFSGTVIHLQADKGHEHRTTLRALTGLSSLLREAGDLRAALVNLERVAAGYREHPEFGSLHADTLMVLGSLASLREELGDLGTARTLWKEVSHGWHQSVGPHHARTLAAFAQAHQVQRALQRTALS